MVTLADQHVSEVVVLLNDFALSKLPSNHKSFLNLRTFGRNHHCITTDCTSIHFAVYQRPMAQKRDTREQIKRAMAPWQTSEEKPPFSDEELVVMALLSNDEPQTQTDIGHWLLNNACYYRRFAAAKLMSHSYDSYSYSPLQRKARDINKRIRTILHKAEFPAEEEEEVDQDTLQVRWRMSVADAVHLLGGIVGARPAVEPFPFTKLPAELRNTVYKLVFAYPRSGLEPQIEHICRGGQFIRTRRFRVINRSYDHSLDFQQWAGYHDRKFALYTRNTDCILAILLVNRQLHQEAMPFFYNVNTFYVRGITELYNFLFSTPETRRKHLGHIAFTYELADHAIAAKAFKLLAQVDSLRLLDINMNEQAWLGLSGGGGKPVRYPDVSKIPGLASLRDVKVSDSVTFHGNCPRIEAMLKTDMLKHGQGRKKPAQRSRKRGIGGGTIIKDNGQTTKVRQVKR